MDFTTRRHRPIMNWPKEYWL